MSLSINSITKRYGSQTALNNVSIDIEDGWVVGLLGPNGAGKSTLMKIITGYVSADAGSVRVCGHDIIEEPKVVRQLIGYLPEHNPLYTEMYVREYLEMVSGMYGVSDGSVRRKKADEMVEMTGLGREAHKKIGALSKGYRQRVGIAQALICDPKVVILDEPTTGLDPNQIVDIRQLIKELGKERTVVLSTHIMQEVEAVCDHLVILDRGDIKAQGPINEVLTIAKGGQIVDVEFFAEIENRARVEKELGVRIKRIGEHEYRVSASQADDDIRLLLFRYASQTDNPILEMRTEKADLERVFHEVTTKTE